MKIQEEIEVKVDDKYIVIGPHCFTRQEWVLAGNDWMEG